MYPPPIPTHGIRLRVYVATEQGQRVQTNKPDSREVPHFIRRQEGRAWMKFTISSFSVRKVFQVKSAAFAQPVADMAEDLLLLAHACDHPRSRGASTAPLSVVISG